VRTKVLCFWKWGYRFPLLLIYYAFTVRKIWSLLRMAWWVSF
jgi:hypothetical protein